MTTIDRTEFQRRRDHGLKARHARRLARYQTTAPPPDPVVTPPHPDDGNHRDTGEQVLG